MGEIDAYQFIPIVAFDRAPSSYESVKLPMRRSWNFSMAKNPLTSWRFRGRPRRRDIYVLNPIEIVTLGGRAFSFLDHFRAFYSSFLYKFERFPQQITGIWKQVSCWVCYFLGFLVEAVLRRGRS